jgi:hypothetical protein
MVAIERTRVACLALLFLAGVSVAHAHIPDQPDWTDWLMQQRNQKDAMCCHGGDTVMLSDTDWRMKGDHYEVRFGGVWMIVPDWARTVTQDNPTGSALLWIWQGRVQCFKPGFSY